MGIKLGAGRSPAPQAPIGAKFGNVFHMCTVFLAKMEDFSPKVDVVNIPKSWVPPKVDVGNLQNPAGPAEVPNVLITRAALRISLGSTYSH